MTSPIRHGLIKQGDRSARVADVQSKLRALEYEIGDDLGTFGDATRQAVRTFQQRRGILSDGIVGPNTWDELVEASWRLGDRLLYLKHPPARGDDVVLLQGRLNALGFDAGREDGIFGVDTDRAIRAFQKEYGVAEDGVFGPRSHSALVGLRVDRPGTAALLREELRRSELSGIRGEAVIIDPGHGGSDPGSRSPNGLRESDLCWDIATRAAQRLAAAGAIVRFTRTEAESPDNSERARRANELGSDLFISLHLNSHDEGAAEGSSTYFFGGSKLGEALADGILEELIHLGIKNCRSHARSYPVLKETRMPAVLVEPAFITNADEEKMLDDPAFRSALGEAIANGVHRFYNRARTRPTG